MRVQEDLYYPHPLVQDILWASLHKLMEPIMMHRPAKKLREKAVRIAMEHMHYEDENTRYICIGPVNKVCKVSNFQDTCKKITMLDFFLTCNLGAAFCVL